MIKEIENKINNTTDKKELKKLYKMLKEEYKKCARNGHSFGEWEDLTYYEDKYYNEPYSFNKGYFTVKYPIYKRVCKNCGIEEIVNELPKEKRMRK